MDTSKNNQDDDDTKVEDPMANNEDRLRKIAHLQEKQDQLKQKKRRKYVEKRAKSEATRYRARASSSKFIDMFANSAANNDLKEVAVVADGKDESVTVRGISLDEI